MKTAIESCAHCDRELARMEKEDGRRRMGEGGWEKEDGRRMGEESSDL